MTPHPYTRTQQLSWQQDATSQDFHHYLQSVNDYLTLVHGESSALAEQVRPFEWVPPGFWEQPYTARRGVILVHGLLGSPLQLHDIGQAFLKAGYLVRSILLTGHGLTPEALDTVVWQDWLSLVAFACQQLAADVAHAVWLGYSGGGALCLQQALTSDVITELNLKNLITIAPPLRLKTPLATLIPLLRFWPKPIKFHSISMLEPAKYPYFSQFFSWAAYQLAHTTQQLLHKNRLPVPGYFVLAANDGTIDSNTVMQTALADPNPHHHLLWYSHTAPNPLDPRVTWRTSCYPDRHIDDYSHISLYAAPDNPVYGEALYRQACLASTKPRLHFNPDFDGMMANLLAFCRS